MTAAISERSGRRTDLLLLVTLFAATFEKLHWEVGVSVSLADLLAIVYLISFAVDCVVSRDLRAPRTALVTLAFAAAFLVCYLAGFFNIETVQGLTQFSKGMAKLVIHLLFLTVAVVHLSSRSQRFFWKSLAFFLAGMAANAAYGVVQLGAAEAGLNLDKRLLDPLTGGAATSINIYGAVGGQNVYRPNALTGDPNHLGVMLIVPLLILVPLYLRLERGHRLRWPLAVLLGFLLVVELATLSRSGLLGLGVGLLVLALPYRRFFIKPRFFVPLAGVCVFLAAVVFERRHFFATVISSRLQTGGRSNALHFGVYDFVPQVLHSHPLFGLGLNNFSVYYQFVTGKTNWGPHSFYVATIVEGGIIGSVIFAVFLWYLFRRLASARAIGRALTAAGDALAARVRPLAWGMTAALVGTMASNVFYLTMQFYYFYAFAALALATPLVFARARTEAAERRPRVEQR
ncbi:MAG: O-antigen ligase family protein [Gaiellaceae bacterium]